MNPDGMFNWPDGDVILRATDGTETRDFRVHKLFLSFSSPVFKDMFNVPQPPSSSTPWDGVEVIDVADPPRALELILRFIYPSSTLPVIDDLTVLSEALVLADKYDVEVARSRLRSSFTEFAKAEPLRAYAVACRFGLADEMKIASAHTISIHLPDLADLPDEFKLVPATEYHRLILLHSKFRKEVGAIAGRTPLPGPVLDNIRDLLANLTSGDDAPSGTKAREAAKKNFEGSIREGIPLNREALLLALKSDYNLASTVPGTDLQSHVSSILSQASDLNLTI